MGCTWVFAGREGSDYLLLPFFQVTHDLKHCDLREKRVVNLGHMSGRGSPIATMLAFFCVCVRVEGARVCVLVICGRLVQCRGPVVSNAVMWPISGYDLRQSRHVAYHVVAEDMVKSAYLGIVSIITQNIMIH